MTVATSDEVRRQIRLGLTVAEISEASCWPCRQIQLLAARMGYLVKADGTPYRPPDRVGRLPS